VFNRFPIQSLVVSTNSDSIAYRSGLQREGFAGITPGSEAKREYRTAVQSKDVFSTI